MPADSSPITSRHTDGVAWIEINRPERRNAIDSESKALLAAAFDEASESEEVRVAVLKGNGGSFSAGIDLKESLPAAGGSPSFQRDDALVAPLERCTKPIIAAIDGPAIGGGFELALTAEMRIATGRSFFALTEVAIGSLPGSGGTQRLFRALPSAVAWKILLSSERLSAKQAYQFGLVSDLVEVSDMDSRVGEVAAAIAAKAPLSLQAAKLAGNAGIAAASDAGLHLERALWAFLATTRDRHEGREAFREGRDPRFEGR